MGKERHAVDSDDCSSDTEKADEVEEEEPSEVDSEEESIEEDPFEEEPDEEDPCEEEPDEEDPCEEEQSEEGSCEEEPDEDPYDESNMEGLHGQEPNEVPCEEEPNRQASCEEVVIEGHSCESSREDETNEEPFEEDRHEEQYEIEQPEDSEPDEEEPSEEPSEEEPNELGEPSGDDRYTGQSNPEKRNMSADAISGPKVSIGSNVMVPGKLDNAKDSGRKRHSRWDVEAGSNGTADGSIDVAKKKRKSRWSSDDSQLNSTIIVSDHDVVSYQAVVKLHAQLFEITQKLQARELVDERPDGERSPSPPPLYNNLGMKINSREIRLRERLNLQRQMIISELIQKNPNYVPPPDCKSPNRSNSPSLTAIPKFHKKLYIPSKEYPEYNFVGLIIGPRGHTQKRMEKETGAKILLRGKGSVLVAGRHRKLTSYDNDDLHVLIEAGSKSSLDAAVAMVEKLLIPVEDGRNVHKLAQLQELATLNGSLRNKVPINSGKLCDVCGDATHSTSACPLTASDPGANTNDCEVNYISELRGAFSAFSAPALPSNPGPISGGFPNLHQPPHYPPGYAAIAHSNPGPMSLPGPPRPVLPEPGASFVKNGGNSVYHYPFHGQSSVSLGPSCRPPPPTLLSRDVAASDELANFPGYLKSLGPPSQLLQASQTTFLSSSQVHFTPNFSHPYMPPP